MASNSLKDYLKRYESKSEEQEKKKKKKKKTKPAGAVGVLVVDEDPVWQKPVAIEEEEENDSPDDTPVVDEDIEVKRQRRLEVIRMKRAQNAIAEDGSGWVSLSKDASSVDPITDISPPRRQRTRNDTPSPDHKQIQEETDLSPPRKQRARNDTPSPEHRVEKKLAREDADLSPPRKRRARNDSPSPEPVVRPKPTREDTDLSPPRKHRTRNDSPSPEPRVKPKQTVEATDLSPPRKRRARNDSASPEPVRKHVRDFSPPRQRQSRNRESSTMPDISPPRRPRANVVSDLSPPRKDRNEPKEQRKTGLISGREIGEEISKTKKEDLRRFKEMDASVTGRGAEAVFRDKKTGQRISKEDYLKSKNKVEVKPKEKELEWGKGLAQKREAEARLQELELEKEKPFARTRDDPELDNMLKDRLRWGDPMAHLVKKKNYELDLRDLGVSEKMKESGFVVPQGVPTHSWLKRGLDAAPNRYGIRPGRHWDGVDRSNGFEKKMFKRSNEKQATQKEAYLWSVADM